MAAAEGGFASPTTYLFKPKLKPTIPLLSVRVTHGEHTLLALGKISHKEIRQANDQLRVLASDRGEPAPPAGSVTVVVSPKPAVNETGIAGAEHHVHVVEPKVVTELAYDARATWEDLLAIRAGNTAEELREVVATTLLRYGLLPTQIRERLTATPVSGLSNASVAIDQSTPTT